MATKIFPSTNDVNGGVAGQGKTLTEKNMKTLQAMPYFDKPYVKDGATCTNGGGLNLSAATGNYCIDGRWIYKDATETVLLTASSTCRVWLQLAKDGSGNVTGTTWNVQTGTTVPTDSVLVAVVVTGAATITTITQTPRGIISPGKQIGFAQRDTDSSSAGGVTMSLTVCGDGQTPVRVQSTVATVAMSAAGAGAVEIRVGATSYANGTYYSWGAAVGAAGNPPETRPIPAWTTGNVQFDMYQSGTGMYLGGSAAAPTRPVASLEAFWDF